MDDEKTQAIEIIDAIEPIFEGKECRAILASLTALQSNVLIYLLEADEDKITRFYNEARDICLDKKRGVI